MVNPLVERATTDLLMGPDWSKNAEICDVLINDPSQTKDVLKGVRKRMGSRNPKVQLLALILLETMMNNCGNLVHLLVAEKGILDKMVKIAKKKRNYHVREKILMLIESWQEAFGGSGSRYPQYYSAYHDLLRSGAAFPKNPDRRTPVFTAVGAHPLTAYAESALNPSFARQRARQIAENSEENEFPTLSLSEIQNVRGIVDVLAEMLNGLDPGNKEGLRQEALVDLVQQCQTYKLRVVHLINSTADESLLTQGLALNDDLQRLLAKHEAIASGNASEQAESSKSLALIDIDEPSTSNDTTKLPNGMSTLSTNPGNQALPDLLLLDPGESNGSLTAPAKVDAGIDLLSGENENSEAAADALAFVPIGDPQSSDPAFQNALVLANTPPQNNAASAPVDPLSLYSAGQAPSSGWDGSEAAIYSNVGALYQQEQSINGEGQGDEASLPLPPWETELEQEDQAANGYQDTQMALAVVQPQPYQDAQQIGVSQMPGMYTQQAIPNGPMNVMYYQSMYQGFQGNPQQAMQGRNYMYPQSMQTGQFQNYSTHPQFLDQRMHDLSIRDHDTMTRSHIAASYTPPPMRPARPPDNLFGDLVSMAKLKPKNSS